MGEYYNVLAILGHQYDDQSRERFCSRHDRLDHDLFSAGGLQDLSAEGVSPPQGKQR